MRVLKVVHGQTLHNKNSLYFAKNKSERSSWFHLEPYFKNPARSFCNAFKTDNIIIEWKWGFFYGSVFSTQDVESIKYMMLLVFRTETESEAPLSIIR